jgi:hypothetical protein
MENLQLAVPLPLVALCAIVAVVVILRAVRPLQQSHASAVHQKRVRRIQLVLQLCVAALLLFYLARPVWIIEGDRSIKPTVFVLYDDSKSSTVKDVVLSSGKRTRRSELMNGYIRSKLTSHLSSHWEVEEYVFSRELRRLLPGKMIDARGSESRIADVLKDVVRGSDKAGKVPDLIILPTDGVDRGSKDTVGDVAAIAGERGIPIHTILIGQEEAYDRQLDWVRAPEVVLARQDVNIDVQMSHRGAMGESAELSLTLSPGDRKQLVRLKLARDVVAHQFKVRLPKAGVYSVIVSLEIAEHELDKSNNHQRAMIKAVDRRIRVLYVEAMPRWFYRYATMSMRRARLIEPSVLLGSADADVVATDSLYVSAFPSPKKLFSDYDVVVIGDIDASFLSTSQQNALTKFVSDHGGGLLFIAGNQHLKAYPKEIRKMLPVRNVRSAQRSRGSNYFGLVPGPRLQGPDYELIDFLGNRRSSLRVWNEVQLGWAAGAELNTVRGVGVMMKRGGRNPVVAYQRFGDGRSVYVGSDDLWRIRELPNGPEMLDRMVQQFIVFAYAGRLQRARTLRLDSKKKSYAMDEPIEIRARVLDQDYDPSTLRKLKVYVQDLGDNPNKPLKKERPLTMVADELNPGEFVAKDMLKAGYYRVWMPVPEKLGGKQVPAAYDSFEVVNVPGELKQPSANHAVLKDIAHLSGGRAHSPRLDDLQNVVKATPKQAHKVRTIKLWKSPIPLVLLIAFTAAAWWHRQRVRLA